MTERLADDGVSCIYCLGDGRDHGAGMKLRGNCPWCDGTGRRKPTGAPNIVNGEPLCHACDGSGRVDDVDGYHEQPCPACDGKDVI